MREPETLRLTCRHSDGISYTLRVLRWRPAPGRQIEAPPVVCVHGLTRNAGDFAVLAAHLAEAGREVLAPDVVGRGRSDRLADPVGYTYPRYLTDMKTLIADLAGGGPVDWVGTSMGGLFALFLAAEPNAALRHIVLNDIGPFAPAAALAYIGEYAGQTTRFATRDEASAHLWTIYQPFGIPQGPLWEAFVDHSLDALPEGGFVPAYDPGIANAFKDAPARDLDLWGVWDRMTQPVLVLRGETSTLLLPETAQEMVRRGPRARVVTLPGYGHAPGLVTGFEADLILAHLQHGRA